jgi:MFS family permease
MLSLQAILSTFADNIYSNWLPQFLAQVHQLEFKQMGIFAALPLLGGAIAGFLGGALNDYWLQRTGNRRWARAGVACAGKFLAALALLAALTQYERPYVFCGFLFVVKALGDWSLVSLLGVVTDIGGRATASVFALVNTIAGIGQITAPLVFGFVADHYGWRPVFVLVAITYALCAATWLAIDGTRPTGAARLR